MTQDINAVRGTAIVLTDGMYKTKSAKTAHGLVRGSARFETLAIIDHTCAGEEAGTLLDGQQRNIPIYGSIAEALEQGLNPTYAIIGVATPGGILPSGLIDQVKICLSHGISAVNGLHDNLCDHDSLVALAASNGVSLYDVRKPKKYNEYNFWSPDIFQLKTPVVAVMGTDCSVGKRTSCGLLTQACADSDINATMIYTGQTGWMQGYEYGFVLDTTLNDFVSGELCHAVLSADKATNPDVILIEGQAALRNPSGPCGAEFIISANAKNVILVHEEKTYYHDEPSWGTIKSLESEIALIEAYDANVIGICLNTANIPKEEALKKVEEYKAKYKKPVVAPLYQPMTPLITALQSLIDEN